MRAASATDRASLIGYAFGVGLVFVATMGVYWRFWQPGTSVFIWAGGSFVIGAAAGAAVAAWRRRSTRGRTG